MHVKRSYMKKGLIIIWGDAGQEEGGENFPGATDI